MDLDGLQIFTELVPLYLLLIEVLLLYSYVKVSKRGQWKGSIETQHVPECIIMIQNNNIHAVLSNGKSLQEYKLEYMVLTIAFIVFFSSRKLPALRNLQLQFHHKASHLTMTVLKGDHGCLCYCLLQCLRLWASSEYLRCYMLGYKIESPELCFVYKHEQ